MKLDHRFRATVCALACAKLLALSLYSSVASAAPSITWRPEAINHEIPAGATVTLRTSFVASEEIQDATLRVVPSLARYVQAVQVYPAAGATIRPYDPAQVMLNVSVPQALGPVTLNGVVQLKSAGQTNKTYAKPLPVTLAVVAPVGGLPPDPGEAGKATLLGIDVNENGIRDDVERYIVLENRDKPKLIPPLLHFAWLTQEGLRQHKEGAAFPPDYLGQLVRNQRCLWYLDSEGGDRLLEVLDIVSNTPERWITNLELDKEVAGGKMIKYQESSEKDCEGLRTPPG